MTDGQTEWHSKANNRFSQICESVKKILLVASSNNVLESSTKTPTYTPRPAYMLYIWRMSWRCAPPQHSYPVTILHGVTTQKTITWTVSYLFTCSRGHEGQTNKEANKCFESDAKLKCYRKTTTEFTADYFRQMFSSELIVFPSHT
jgi:hypothetical protein